MKQSSKIKSNFIYSFSYQILSIILPFITAPYLARRLGANLVGLYSKTHAVAHYFYLFTILGVNNYGNRCISRIRDDRAKLSTAFWEIYFFQALTSFFVTVLYVLFCLSFEHEYKTFYLLQGFHVLSGMFEINWFCFGLERFKLTTLRNTAVRSAIIIAVFVFVRDKSDLWKYILILSLGNVVSVFIVWPFVMKHVDFVRPSWSGIKQHIKPNLVLFWPVVASSFYNIMDRIILGYFSPNEEVAFYSYAERVVTIPATMILALDNVVMPRMSNIFAKNDTEQAEKLMSIIMLFAMFMASAMAFGVAGISGIFAPWFYGKEFTRCGLYILLLAPTIIFKGWAGALRTQFIIPTGRDNIYIISLTSGAVINLILDFTLIPSMNGVGAIIGTLAAELSVASIQFFMCRKNIPLKEYFKNGIAFIFIGIGMYFCVDLIGQIGLPVPTTLAIQVVSGAVIYIIAASVYMIMTKQPVLVNEGLKTLKIKYRFK